MQKNVSNVITAIDLGTDKCVTLIAVKDSDKPLPRVVGVAAVPSKGMRKSSIVDLEQAVSTIDASLAAAEKMAGLNVQSAYISVGGSHISSQNSKGMVAVSDPNVEINESDVERAIEAARAITLPADREVLYLTPRYFKVDSQEGIRDPIGMVGMRLETECHIITGSAATLRNLEKCLKDIDLEKDGFVFSGFASGEVILTETEKELGVVAVDIGAGSTNFCCFVDGAITYSGSVPVGARHITQDITVYSKVSFETAEKIKLLLSDEDMSEPPQRPDESKEDYRRRKKQMDIINASALDTMEKVPTLSKSTLIKMVIFPRLKEIFMLIGEQLRKQKITNDKIPAGLVITGGGAKTVGILEVANRTLSLPARVGTTVGIDGLVNEVNDPTFSTAVGVLTFGSSELEVDHGGRQSIKGNKNVPLDGFFNKLTSTFKNFMP
ncbi:MAG: cell division protein FtsA [Pseudomonadales bacterium]|jgi:cell division protein FtsA|nr:cell division protein FtsA [Pseudomonadales bacterium]